MISGFEMKDFKGHEDWISVALNGLTILTGTNNSGKTSVMQGIYLLSQNQNFDAVSSLNLNKDLELGKFTDILNKEKENDDPVEFAFTFDQQYLQNEQFTSLSVHFVYKDIAVFDEYRLLSDIPVLFSMEIDGKYMEEEIHYSFELIGGLEEDDPLYEVRGNYDNGFCVMDGIKPGDVLYANRDKEGKKLISTFLEEALKHISKISEEHMKYLRSDDPYTITRQHTAKEIYNEFKNKVDYLKEDQKTKYRFSELFDKWIKKILGDQYRIRSEKPKDILEIFVEDTSYEVPLKLKLNQVGFGISQLLPIITLILTSRKGNILLIENPEIHMHPKLQSDLVELFLFAVANGRKLVIETHSEHIINRLRLEIKRKKVDIDKISIYYYEKEQGVIRGENIEIDQNGKISNWPKHFFDQNYHDLLGLIENDTIS